MYGVRIAKVFINMYVYGPEQKRRKVWLLSNSPRSCDIEPTTAHSSPARASWGYLHHHTWHATFVEPGRRPCPSWTRRPLLWNVADSQITLAFCSPSLSLFTQALVRVPGVPAGGGVIRHLP